MNPFTSSKPHPFAGQIRGKFRKFDKFKTINVVTFERPRNKSLGGTFNGATGQWSKVNRASAV